MSRFFHANTLRTALVLPNVRHFSEININDRDVEAVRSKKVAIALLRRVADNLEAGKPWLVQVSGRRLRVPATAEFSVEHECEGVENCIELQFKWEGNKQKKRAPKEEGKEKE